MHNWEMIIQFSVHGQGKTLFGDGLAIWYTKGYGKIGPVFGNTDYFTGLGIFFDTYSNHNGEHSVSWKLLVGSCVLFECFVNFYSMTILIFLPW